MSNYHILTWEERMAVRKALFEGTPLPHTVVTCNAATGEVLNVLHKGDIIKLPINPQSVVTDGAY